MTPLCARPIIARPSNQYIAHTIDISTPKQRHTQHEAVKGSPSDPERQLLDLGAITTRRARAAFQHAGAR